MSDLLRRLREACSAFVVRQTKTTNSGKWNSNVEISKWKLRFVEVAAIINDLCLHRKLAIFCYHQHHCVFDLKSSNSSFPPCFGRLLFLNLFLFSTFWNSQLQSMRWVVLSKYNISLFICQAKQPTTKCHIHYKITRGDTNAQHDAFCRSWREHLSFLSFWFRKFCVRWQLTQV